MILPILHQRLGTKPELDHVTEVQVAELATTSHRFTLLAVIHAGDYTANWLERLVPGSEHPFDIEGILLVEGPDGLEGMATQAHFDWSWRAGITRLSQGRRPLPPIEYTLDHPDVWIESGGHGIHSGKVADAKIYNPYFPKSMFHSTGLWTRRRDLFTQDNHGRWMLGGAHAPWSWAGRIGYPGLVATDPVSFIEQSGVRGFSPLSRQYTKNPFWGIA
jgi:hypothetical protein